MLGLVKNGFRRPWGYAQNDKGIALLATMAVSMILMALGLGYYMKNTMEVEIVVRSAEQTQSFYGAEAGINWGLRNLQFIITNAANGNLENDWLTSVKTPTATAYVAYRREDATPWDPTDDLYFPRRGFLYSTTLNAVTSKQERTIVVKVSVALPPAPFSTATLSGPNGSGGGFVIDGRDHKMVVPNETTLGWSPQIGTDNENNGTLGIITDAGDFNRKGSSTIGGTTEAPNVDVVPTTTQYGADGWDQVVDLFRADLKHSPDEVLLYSVQGQAKQTAITDGTYYLNPANGLNLTLQDNKIYYFEFTGAAHVDFQNLVLNMDAPTSSAVVIIHHKSLDDADPSNDFEATMKLMEGTFKGVLIADQVDKIHGNIIGSLVTIGGTRKSIGNGNGGIYYSLDVASQISQYVGQTNRLRVDRWEEDNTKDVTQGIF